MSNMALTTEDPDWGDPWERPRRLATVAEICDSLRSGAGLWFGHCKEDLGDLVHYFDGISAEKVEVDLVTVKYVGLDTAHGVELDTYDVHLHVGIDDDGRPYEMGCLSLASHDLLIDFLRKWKVVEQIYPRY
jgi:hypothetical protein